MTHCPFESKHDGCLDVWFSDGRGLQAKIGRLKCDGYLGVSVLIILILKGQNKKGKEQTLKGHINFLKNKLSVIIVIRQMRTYMLI